MVASISASLNLPSLCDLVRELANRDHEQASRQTVTKLLFMPTQCAPGAGIRKQNAEAPRDSAGLHGFPNEGGRGSYSTSLLLFLRLRLRASASLVRFFSPGFR